MSQHRVTFKRADEDGLRFSHCGRFVVRHVPDDLCRYVRWRLIDLEEGDGLEVFAAQRLKDCRSFAVKILSGDAQINHVPVEVQRERRAAEEDAAARAYQAELDAIEAELLMTDEPCDDEPAATVVSVTRREPVRTTQVVQRWETTERLQRLRDERWTTIHDGAHVVPARRPPVPRAWVDLVARVYEHGALRLIERRVYIRDHDTAADIWRRCKHAIFSTEDSREEHEHQDQGDAQGEAHRSGRRRDDQRQPESCDRRHRRPDPDRRGRGQASAEQDRAEEHHHQALGAAAPQGRARRRRPRGQAAPRARQVARAPRRAPLTLALFLDDDTSGRAAW